MDYSIFQPRIVADACLNTRDTSGAPICTLCHDICPAQAIEIHKRIPRIDASVCTGCTACATICPADAIPHPEVRPVTLLKDAMNRLTTGKKHLHAACSAASQQEADVRVPCHAAWDPLLLASMAAEGVSTLHLDGISQCDNCPLKYGAQIMKQTEKDYATLNHALGKHLEIAWQAEPHPAAQKTDKKPEPERRVFFRNLFPSMAQTAAMAAAQIGHTVRQSDDAASQTDTSPLPVRLQLFLRALPALQPNFTPVPAMPSLPLGAIQADASCTACGQCVEQCPTEALHLKEFGANSILEFKPHACIGCKRCIEICPENALELLPSISLPAILAMRARPLVMVANANIANVPANKKA